MPLTAADYNEDGKMDLVVGAGGDSSVRLHLGNGDGTFQSGGTIIQYTGSGNPWPLAADLNGDGHQDVVVWDDAINQIFILLGNGSGSFASSTITVPNVIRRAALGDLNNDGKLDLVGAGSGDLLVLLGNGDGTFQPAVDVPVADSILAGCVVADFDLDGRADVAVTSSDRISGGTDDRVLVFPGDGAGNLGTPETFTGVWWPQGLVAADFNNDGLPDLAFAAQNYDIPVLINSVLGPPNDNWVNAAVVDSLPYTSIVDTTQATTELTDPYPGCGNSSTAKSVWYVFTPTFNGTVTANTFGSNYDTILAAFTGAPGAFVWQACNDDYSGLQSQISFSVTAGVMYSFMVTSYGSGVGGSLFFNLSFIPAGPYVSLSPTTLNFGNQVVNTTSAAQTVTVTNVGNADLVVSGVSLTGSMPGDFAIVSDGCSGAYVVPSYGCTFGVTFTPTAGGSRTANVSISDNAPDTPQTVSLAGTGLAGPPNDNWANAAVISGVPYTNTVDTTQATTAGTDPSPGCGNGSTAKSVWYVFTPTLDGIVTANTFGSNYDTILAAYTGGPGAFSLQACNDDYSGLQSQISFGVAAGITYSFMATSYGSGGGSLVFNLSFMPTAPYVSLSPTALDFGEQVVNTTSAAQTVTVTNVGNTDLAVSGVSLSGLIPQDFMIVSDACSGAYVVPSGFCTLGVTFTPHDLGSRTAQINIYDNAADAPQTVPLQGTGIVQPPELTWLSPWSAAPGGPEFTLTVNGSLFTSNSVVRWNGSDRVTTFLSDTQLQASIPASDIAVQGSAQVTVYTPDAGISKTLTFAIEFNTLFRADFEAGTQGFAPGNVINTLTWQRTTNRGGDSGHSPTTSFYFGNPSTFNYATGYREGAVLTSSPISLGAAPLTLTFNYFLATENFDYYDIAEVQVSNDGGYTFIPLSSNRSSSVLVDNTGSWLSATADLSSYAGQTVVLRFAFDTIDSVANYFEGWYVDDVVVQSSGPSVQFSPTSLDFGNQLTSTTSAPLTETVTNTGTATLTISSVSLTGTNPGDFAKTGDTCTGASVAPANSCTITVTFTPTATGARSATLSISDNASGSPHTVPLTGTGTAPAVTLSPTSLAFGNQLKNTTSSPLTETVTNTGTGTLTISSVSLTGTNSGDFAKTGDTCTGANVAPANSCTITVTFTPTATGARSATLSISDNASGSPHTAPLTGTGTSPAVTLSPPNLNYGNQVVGTTSAAQPVTLTNGGTAPLTISSIVASGDYAQTNNCASPLAVAASCTINVTFTPTAQGTRTGAITVTDNAVGSPHTVSLSGTGILPPGVSLSSTYLGFGNQALATTSAPKPVTLTNSGQGPLTINSITTSGNFAQTNNCVSPLAAAASCTINVTFTPTVAGGQSGTLTIVDNAVGSPHTVGLGGVGVGPVVALSSTSLSFGNQAVGTTSAAKLVNLSNTGNEPLTITGIMISGDFAQTNNCVSPLAAHSYCTLSVTFAPTAAGTRTGLISVTDNALGSPHTVSLTGNGTVPAVSLSPTSLSFGNQAVNTTSAPKPVTLTNSGQAPLTITSIGTSGNYAQTNNCVSPLAAAAFCTVNVTFTPQVVGGQSGTLTIVDNAPGSPHTAALSGAGVGPVAILSSTTLNFGDQVVGTTSAAKPVLLSNSGNAPLTVSSIVASGDYAQTNNCVSPLAAHTYCTISVTFTPTANGTRAGAVTVTDNAIGNPHTVTLTGTGISPAVTLSKTTLSFGNQPLGATSAPQGVTLTNSGYGPLTISSLTASGNYAQTNNCVSPLAGGASCTINVTFTPVVAGGQAGTLTIVDNAAGSPHTVALNGVGVGPVVVLSATSLNFGNQSVNTTSAPRLVNLSNTGNAPLTITSITITGDFAQTSSCVSPLAAHTYCTISITFTPTAVGGRGGTLTIVDNALGSPHKVTVSGTGVGPVASLSTTSLNFGDQPVGTTSLPKTFTLGNSGNAPLTISSIAASGDYAQTNNCVSPLAAHSYCTINVTFAPTAGGTRTGATTIADNAGGSPHAVAVSGTGTGMPAVSLSPSSLSFGNQALATTSAPKPVTLTNSGQGPLTISSITTNGNYAQTNNCVSPLAVAASCTINVTFTPLVVGGQSGTLTIADNASGSPHTVGTGGVGVGPVVALSSTSLSFGNQAVGTTSAAKLVNLSNTGNAPLTIASITISGDFAQTNNCVSPLAAHTYCTLTVTFTPTAAGARTGLITVTDNALGSPHTVSLTGNALAPTVSLSPTNLSFGNQALATTSAPKAVTLTNSGQSPLTISSVGASGNYAQTNNCVSPLAAAASCTINVTFTPQVVGGQSGTLSIVDDAAGSPHTAGLGGVGVGPVATLSPTSLNFGSQAVGSTSAPESVNLGNSGNAPLTITSITASGDYAQTNNCVSPLAASAYCTINITFTPTGVGGRGGALTIVDSASGSPRTVSLTGVGVGPLAALAPSSLAFGSLGVGATSAPKAVILSNSGNASLTISNITTSSDYAQTSNCASSLAAHTYCTISVTFTPTASGTRSGTLTVADNAAGSPQSVTLTGNGLGPTVTLSPTSLTFGSLGVGVTRSPQTVTLTNSGAGVLTIRSITPSGDFAQTNNCVSPVAVGGSCTISVTFTPTAGGTRNGTISIADDAPGSPHTVTLTGTGLGPAVTLSPTSLNFGEQQYLTTSSPLPVTLTNNGAGALTISSITASGDYAQTNDCVSPVAAGAFCTINVTFHPTGLQTRTGTLTIVDNAPGSPHTASLTGIGKLTKTP